MRRNWSITVIARPKEGPARGQTLSLNFSARCTPSNLPLSAIPQMRLDGSPRPTPEPTMTSPTTASIPAPTREPTSGATPEPTTTAAPGIPTHHPTHYPSSSPTLPLRTSEPGATFAPHASEAPQQQEPSFECGEEIDAYEQCGGEGFEGTGCCRMGYECVQRTDCYSEVRV